MSKYGLSVVPVFEFGVSRGLLPSLGFEIYSKSSRVTNSKDSNPMGESNQSVRTFSNQHPTQQNCDNCDKTLTNPAAPSCSKYHNRSDAAQNAKVLSEECLKG